MPRLSLYRANKGNDYRFIDRTAREMFEIGGTDINIHLYLGPQTSAGGDNATNPAYTSDSVSNIQDLLFLENRDRKYDTSIYTLRGVYRISDNDFDLQQFGLFLTGDTIFMTFHLNTMVEALGRKIMIGDVFELPHLKDYYPLDDAVPAALKRYFVVQDATNAAEGYSVTWYPHLWRVKLAPLVDSQEYKDIINNIKAGDNTTNTIGDVLSTIDKYINVNDAIVNRAEKDVPASGYDTTFIYTEATTSTGYPSDPVATSASYITADASYIAVDATSFTVDVSSATISSSEKPTGYLTSDGLPPNKTSVATGVEFPSEPLQGDYFLRLDYYPNRLFRFEGLRWLKIEDNVRTSLTPGVDNKTLRSGFVNNTNTNMSGPLAWDAIRVADPYTPVATDETQSFTLSSNAIVSKTAFNIAYGVKTFINGIGVANTVSNVGGVMGITIASTPVINSVVEYTIYSNVIVESQGLSSALNPDN